MDKSKLSHLQIEEEFKIEPIPENERQHWLGTASIYMGMTAVIACAMGGGALISGLSFGKAILAMVLGLIALYVLIYIPIGKAGAEHGLNTYQLGEMAFGTIGSKLSTAFIVTIIPCVGWYGIETAIATQAITETFSLGLAVSNILTVIFGLIFALPAMFGIQSMVWLNYISIPVMFFIVIYGVIKAIVLLGGIDSILAYTPATAMTLGQGVNLQIGMLAVGAAFVADYSRWMKGRWSDMAFSGAVGLFPWALILTISGMIMAVSSTSLGVPDPWNIVSVMVKLGMPSIALVLIFLLQWTTAITAAYSSGLALSNVFPGSKFWWTLTAAVVGILLAISGIVNYFMPFVITLASWVAPVPAVMATEYYFVSRRRFLRKPGVYWPGIVAWFIGGLVSYGFTTFFVPAINGMILAAVLYAVLTQIASTGAEREMKREVLRNEEGSRQDRS